MTLIDTNVLLDIVTNDSTWAAWSILQLDAAAIRGPIAINGVIYAELSARFATIEALDSMLARAEIELVEVPRPALFLAGKVFRRYRAAGGARTGVLPDFFIGAHAAIGGFALLTRDVGRYRTYFPRLDVLSPQ
ncbi:MAG TPA: type II toxin-antitoxin system VapC family toxin [Micropepsaceae bacterium]|nr:type II toxin-antitoxin system VapC family toxin [Micropepsaceae bacterium]